MIKYVYINEFITQFFSCVQVPYKYLRLIISVRVSHSNFDLMKLPYMQSEKLSFYIQLISMPACSAVVQKFKVKLKIKSI